MSARRKDDLTKMDLDRAAARRAAAQLWKAFVWSGSKEGGDYWHKIAKRLEALAATPKPSRLKSAAKPTPAQTNKGEG